MAELETATNAPITFIELELLIRRIIEDFTLINAAQIKKELHNLSDEQANTIGLSVQDFIDYNTKKNSFGKSAFTYLYHINHLLQKLVEKSVINKVSSLGGLPILSDMYVSLNMPSPEEEWLKITSYAEYLGLDYVRERISPFTAIIRRRPGNWVTGRQQIDNKYLQGSPPILYEAARPVNSNIRLRRKGAKKAALSGGCRRGAVSPGTPLRSPPPGAPPAPAPFPGRPCRGRPFSA